MAQPAASAGFTLVARNGAAGQALINIFPAGGSARAVFRATYREATPYFDRAPTLEAAFGDPEDHQLNAFFRTVSKGTPVRGLIALEVQSGKAAAALIFDREDQFAKSLPALLKQMSTALPKTHGSDGGGGGMPQLTRTPLADGSGYIGLAPGWRITGAYKGTVDAQGPHGTVLSLGGYQQVFRQLFPGSNSPVMSGAYRQPWPAWQLYVDFSNKSALSRGEASLRLIEQSPQPQEGGQAAFLSYEFDTSEAKRRGLAYVITRPFNDDIGTWFFYSSFVDGPADTFDQDLPVMWAMWKSWSVSPAVFRERMDAALQSMREIYRIIQEVHARQARAYANADFAWDETIRGVTMIEDICTRERVEVDTNHVDRLVDRLNRHGYHVRIVPLGELVQ
jgi:hypothetical protein